jgi:hypothetical protein
MERMEKPHDEPPEVQWIKSPPTMADRSVPTSRVNIYLVGTYLKSLPDDGSADLDDELTPTVE